MTMTEYQKRAKRERELLLQAKRELTADVAYIITDQPNTVGMSYDGTGCHWFGTIDELIDDMGEPDAVVSMTEAEFEEMRQA